MANKKALSRDQLTQAPELEQVEVDKLGGGGVVYVRPLPVSLGFTIWRRQSDDGEPVDPEDVEDRSFEEMLPDLVVYGMVDEKGQRILTDDDRDVIDDWPLGDASAIARAVMEVSGLTAQSEERIEGN